MISFDFAVEGGAINTQNFSASGNVPFIVSEHLQDVGFFNFFKRIASF
jgi:hypothetical protein